MQRMVSINQVHGKTAQVDFVNVCIFGDTLLCDLHKLC